MTITVEFDQQLTDTEPSAQEYLNRVYVVTYGDSLVDSIIFDEDEGAWWSPRFDIHGDWDWILRFLMRECITPFLTITPVEVF